MTPDGFNTGSSSAVVVASSSTEGIVGTPVTASTSLVLERGPRRLSGAVHWIVSVVRSTGVRNMIEQLCRGPVNEELAEREVRGVRVLPFYGLATRKPP